MPRLFTGIGIPERETAELALLRGGLPGARWVEPADYHITLRFIGEVGISMANEIAIELDNLQLREIPVVIRGLDVFGGDRPRSIIAKVEATEALASLQADHERLMRRLGLRSETRKFIPHVTLARVRGLTALDTANYIETRGAFGGLSFVARQFILYSSRDSVGGGPYRVEATYPP